MKVVDCNYPAWFRAAGLLLGLCLLSAGGCNEGPQLTAAANPPDDTPPGRVPYTESDLTRSSKDAASPAVDVKLVNRVIQENILLREEIRKLHIERENLIRLLRQSGYTYDPPKK